MMMNSLWPWLDIRKMNSGELSLTSAISTVTLAMAAGLKGLQAVSLADTCIL